MRPVADLQRRRDERDVRRGYIKRVPLVLRQARGKLGAGRALAGVPGGTPPTAATEARDASVARTTTSYIPRRSVRKTIT